MPRLNRVQPDGAFGALPLRGQFMGNRGCLHDDLQRIRRPFACRRWITCVLEFRGRHRAVMTPGRYTELFFLDEATALAAGHRPCAECRREHYHRFRDAWAEADRDLVGPSSPSADEIDRVLHAERLDDRRGKRTYRASAAELPPGVIVADDSGWPWLVHGQRLVRWEPGGYGRSIPKPGLGTFHVLTPRSIVRAIVQGYAVAVHPSADEEHEIE